MKFLPLLAALALPLSAASAADSTPQLTERGKSLLSSDFSQAIEKDWHVAKGKWEVTDGELHGAELSADMHPGVVRHALDFENAIIQVEVKLDGARQATISINDPKGHLARVLFTPAGYSAQKDDSDHEGPDQAKLFGRRAVALKPGEWHQVQIEFAGDTMVASLDGGNVIAGSHETFTKKKANLGLTVAGESVSYRNLRVWEATPKGGWEETKAKLIAESEAKAPKPAPAAKPAN